MSKVLAIIQARVSSERLPRKVLKKVDQWSVIEHVYRRTVVAVDEAVIAIPAGQRDDELAAECATIGAEVFRGPEDDVLARYDGAARKYGGDIIVRITGDCPFVQPISIRDSVSFFSHHPSAFYFCNCWPDSPDPAGTEVEVFSCDALTQAHRFCMSDSDREDVTPYMRRAGLLNHLDSPRQRVLWMALDTPADLGWFRKVATLIDVEPPWHPTLEELQHLFSQHPDLAIYAKEDRSGPVVCATSGR